MWPFLKGQEKLIVRRIPLSDLRLGDLVLYKSNKQLVCHRLVKKAKNNGTCLIYSRGDASFGSAEPVNEEMLLGKVIAVMKNGKITSLEGLGQQVFNRISPIFSPLRNLIIKSLYRILLKRR